MSAASSSRSDVNRELNWILSLNAPTFALSSGSRRITNCSAASFSRSSVAVMLALVSSMTTTVIGWVSFWKKTSVWGLSLSRTSKSSLVRLGTRRCSASVTVAKSDTTFVPALKVGACADATVAAAAARTTPAIGRQRRRDTTRM